MPTEVTFLSAMLIGLLGSTHCAGMCGGIATALARGGRSNGLPRVGFLFAYNFGRVLSYVVAGFVMGGIGAAIGQLIPPELAHRVAAIISASFLLALAMYIGGWWNILGRLEAYGARFWRHLEPRARKLVPANSLWQALALGLVWGWLPCGLVYTTLVWSLSSGSAVDGAALMFGFGLGTMPTLIAIGALGDTLAGLRGRPLVRHAAGVSLLAVGGVTLWLAFSHGQVHDHHHHVAVVADLAVV